MADVPSFSMYEDSGEPLPLQISENERNKSNDSQNTDCHDVTYAFGWNHFNLNLIGMWPRPKSERNSAGLLTRFAAPIVASSMLFLITGPEFLAVCNYSLALDEFIDLLGLLVGFVTAIVRVLSMWRNEEVLARCIQFMTEDWARKNSVEEREVMMRHANLGRFTSKGFTILLNFFAISYVIMKILPLINVDITNENTTNVGMYLLYPGYFPLDLRKPLIFGITYFVQCIALCVSLVSYSGTDCFIAMLIVHLCGQLTILRQGFANLLDNGDSIDPAIFRSKLGTMVKRHHTLIELAGSIANATSTMLLAVVVIEILQLCLQLFTVMTLVTKADPGHFPFIPIFFSVCYLNVTIDHLFLYCYVGEKLMEESGRIGEASYSCVWYNLSGRHARDLMLVMQRSKNPLRISAGSFVPISLELFKNVIKTSMSYFSVLLTMKQ